MRDRLIVPPGFVQKLAELIADCVIVGLVSQSSLVLGERFRGLSLRVGKLAQVVARGEDGATAIPVDQVEYRAGEPGPLLLLPRGGYRVRVVDAAGNVVHEGTVRAE